METPDTAPKPRWTALRLFKISIVCVPAFLVVAFISFGLFFQLAWDWDADVHTPMIGAYTCIWISGISAVIGVLAVVVMIISGQMFLAGKPFCFRRR